MTIAQRVQGTRAFLAVTALAGAALTYFALANLHPVYGTPAAAIAALAVLWTTRRVFSRRRVVLWLEERLPELQYALVALEHEPHTHFRAALEERVNRARAQRPLARAALKLLGIPLLILAVAQLIVRPVLAGASIAAPATNHSGSGRTVSSAARSRDFVATVTPPGYSRLARATVRNPLSIAALAGSDIEFSGRWSGRATMPLHPSAVRLRDGGEERIVALEPRADSAPYVVISLPARDTVLAAATGVVPLAADARDDFGITSAWFEFIISSGSGESFKFRGGTVGRVAAESARDVRLDARLRLDSLRLEPGDVMHLRAVARDANPAAGAEAGSSETRTLRIFRPGTSDSVSIELALPPEVGKSELSQRMLIILTEKLVAQTRKLSRSAVEAESRSIAQEQSRLRKRVGQIIFSRLTGGEGEDADTVAPGDSLSPAEALLRAADAATGAGVGEDLEEEEGGPVVGVNRPLLEAFNAMWEAERRLGVTEPREALPHMRAALAAIQRARAAERLYLRGRPPKVVLDLAKIRLQGKRDGIDPTARSPRASVVAAEANRRARFSVALELLSREPGAAIDTLTLLRVDALADQPSLAAALAAAIEDLRAGRDATATLRAARRALLGEPQSGAHARWSGAW